MATTYEVRKEEDLNVIYEFNTTNDITKQYSNRVFNTSYRFTDTVDIVFREYMKDAYFRYHTFDNVNSSYYSGWDKKQLANNGLFNLSLLTYFANTIIDFTCAFCPFRVTEYKHCTDRICYGCKQDKPSSALRIKMRHGREHPKCPIIITCNGTLDNFKITNRRFTPLREQLKLYSVTERKCKKLPTYIDGLESQPVWEKNSLLDCHCMIYKKNILLFPCKHTTCNECLRHFTILKCPYCRRKIKHYCKIKV